MEVLISPASPVLVAENPLVVVSVTVRVVEVTVASDTEDPSRVAVTPSAEEAADSSTAVVSQMLLVVVVVHDDEAS